MPKQAIFTHQGYEVGCDARTAGGHHLVRLRAKGNFWLGEHGRKFRKDTGKDPSKWPMYRLDLSTIQPITQEPPCPNAT